MPTEREWLVERGLAKPGRGRFSADAKAALDKARADGVEFDAPKVYAYAARSDGSNSSPTVRATAPVFGSYNPKDVRDWAVKQGMTKATRGRLSTEIVNAFLEAHPKPKEESVPTPTVVAQVKPKEVKAPKEKKSAPKPRAPRAKVRPEAEAWTYAKRRDEDGEHISEPLVAIQRCGECGEGIAYCKGHGESGLPIAPAYLGGGTVMLVKPVK